MKRAGGGREGATLKSNEWNHGQSLSQRSEIDKSGESTGHTHWWMLQPAFHTRQAPECIRRQFRTKGMTIFKRTKCNTLALMSKQLSSKAGIQPLAPWRLLLHINSHRKQFLLRLHLNGFPNKHEQVQGVLSMKFWGFPVMRGLDMIQPLHKQIQQEAGWSQS